MSMASSCARPLAESEKYIWRLSLSPKRRESNPFFSADLMTFDIFEGERSSAPASSPQVMLDGACESVHSNIPSFKVNPKVSSKRFSNRMIHMYNSLILHNVSVSIFFTF